MASSEFIVDLALGAAERIAEGAVWAHVYTMHWSDEQMGGGTYKERCDTAARCADDAVALWHDRYNRAAPAPEHPYVQAACRDCGWHGDKHDNEADADREYQAHVQECPGVRL